MTYVLDTDVLSAILRGDEAPARRLLELAPTEVFVPQPVVAEVAYGLSRLGRTKRRAALAARAARLFDALARVPWTDDVSRHFGAVKVDLERRCERLEDFDVAIAAHALASGAVLVTRNVRHLGRVSGLRVEEWTSAR